MRITKENIEFYILEYLEGNLTIEQQNALLDAIDKNEYFQNIFETYRLTYLKASNTKWNKKERIKKNTNEYIINEWEDLCIRFFENDLTETDKNNILITIQQDSEKRKVFETYRLAKLKPTQETFNNKEGLKKEKLADYTFEELCIRYIENMLSDKEKEQFEKLILNDQEKAKEFQLYKNTILFPNLSITLKTKEKLKKTESKFIRSKTIIWYAAAAAIIVGFLFYVPNLINYHNRTPLIPSSKAFLVINREAYPQKVQSSSKKTAIKLQKAQVNYTKDSNYYAENNSQLAIADTQQVTQNFIATNKMISETNYASSNTFYDDKVIQESLEKIFATYKFSFFQDEIFTEKGQNNLADNKISLWKALKQGSKYFSGYTGAEIKVQEYKRENSTKKEIAIGSFSFSRTTTK